MRAVWSFWSRPFVRSNGASWVRPLDHLLSWVVSVHVAARHYPETVLVTDAWGKQLLIDNLGLPFRTVSTELDRLDAHHVDWWSLGKLVAYNLQAEPFIHLDSDVYLWNRLPRHIEQAQVITQNEEQHWTSDPYRPVAIKAALRNTGGWLPPEWEWGLSHHPLIAECCGILGGQDVEFLRYYAGTAIDIIERAENQAAWRHEAGALGMHMFSVEQYFLTCCLGFHAHHPSSPFRGVRARRLFRSWDEAFNPNESARVGYTHLMGGKRHPDLGARLERRVRRDWPDFFRRCLRLQDFPERARA